jgi:hypothetical protein
LIWTYPILLNETWNLDDVAMKPAAVGNICNLGFKSMGFFKNSRWHRQVQGTAGDLKKKTDMNTRSSQWVVPSQWIILEAVTKILNYPFFLLPGALPLRYKWTVSIQGISFSVLYLSLNRHLLQHHILLKILQFPDCYSLYWFHR